MELTPMRLVCQFRFPLLWLGLFVSNPVIGFSQATEEPPPPKSEPALFLAGPGPYNLNTADPATIAVEAVTDWKTDLRKVQADIRDRQDLEASKVKVLYDQGKNSPQMREFKWRNDPSKLDIQSGRALNALLFDMAEPGFPSSDWLSKSVELPKGITLNELNFRYIPSSAPSEASNILSRGVISFSQLGIEGSQWPAALNRAELEKERHDYEVAAAKLRTQLNDGKIESEAVTELGESIKALREKVQTVKFEKKTLGTEAAKFVQDLSDASRVYDGATAAYLHEILVNTKDVAPATVGELASFMFKYRLQFATVERGPAVGDVYRKIYDAMQRQLKAFRGEQSPDLPAAADGPEFQTTESGLKYRILREGEGRKPTKTDSVICHYKGWLDNQTVFDNSYDRGQPASFAVTGVIPGWVEGLQLMKVGSKFEFEIPSKLGYGSRGSGAAIGPNETLHFIVELISIY
jgi:FKBP-type peptidyl-prolyl cis-trans isomerase